jgi:hypothetical protein
LGGAGVLRKVGRRGGGQFYDASQNGKWSIGRISQIWARKLNYERNLFFKKKSIILATLIWTVTYISTWAIFLKFWSNYDYWLLLLFRKALDFSI